MAGSYIEVTKFYQFSTAFQYKTLLFLVLLLLLQGGWILHGGDKTFQKQAPSLLNPSVNFQKFTEDFYRKGRICPAAYIKGLRHLSSEGATLLLRSNVLPPNIWSVRYFKLYRTEGQDVGDRSDYN